MATPIGSILRAATRKDGEPLNILTCPTHERYESGLCKTGHNFYAIRTNDVKNWNKNYAPVPSNYTLLNPSRGDKQIPPDVEIDLVLSQNKFGQYQILEQFARMLHVPLISLEHTLPVPHWTDAQLDKLGQMNGDINVFISEFSANEWGYDLAEEEFVRVIHHGIDTSVFKPNDMICDRQPRVLSVVNDWVNRDWCCGFRIWQEASKDLPVRVVGDTPGLSLPAKSIPDLVMQYRSSRVFLNTSLISPVPTALLEAMSTGCAVVSTATCMIPEIIQNGENGFISNDPSELRRFCELLLNDEDLAKKMGEKARETILNKFSMEKFVENWNTIFREASLVVFKG